MSTPRRLHLALPTHHRRIDTHLETPTPAPSSSNTVAFPFPTSMKPINERFSSSTHQSTSHHSSGQPSKNLRHKQDHRQSNNQYRSGVPPGPGSISSGTEIEIGRDRAPSIREPYSISGDHGALSRDSAERSRKMLEDRIDGRDANREDEYDRYGYLTGDDREEVEAYDGTEGESRGFGGLTDAEGLDREEDTGVSYAGGRPDEESLSIQIGNSRPGDDRNAPRTLAQRMASRLDADLEGSGLSDFPSSLSTPRPSPEKDDRQGGQIYDARHKQSNPDSRAQELRKEFERIMGSARKGSTAEGPTMSTARKPPPGRVEFEQAGARASERRPFAGIDANVGHRRGGGAAKQENTTTNNKRQPSAGEMGKRAPTVRKFPQASVPNHTPAAEQTDPDLDFLTTDLDADHFPKPPKPPHNSRATASATPGSGRSPKLQVPDITGLTEGLRSPKTKTISHKRVEDSGSQRSGYSVEDQALGALLQQLRSRLSSLERENALSGARVRDLEERLHTTKTGRNENEEKHVNFGQLPNFQTNRPISTSKTPPAPFVFHPSPTRSAGGLDGDSGIGSTKDESGKRGVEGQEWKNNAIQGEEVWAEKLKDEETKRQALEGLVGTLHSHVTRLTESLNSHSHALDILQSQAQTRSQSNAKHTQASRALQAQTTRLETELGDVKREMMVWKDELGELRAGLEGLGEEVVEVRSLVEGLLGAQGDVGHEPDPPPAQHSGIPRLPPSSEAPEPKNTRAVPEHREFQSIAPTPTHPSAAQSHSHSHRQSHNLGNSALPPHIANDIGGSFHESRKTDVPGEPSTPRTSRGGRWARPQTPRTGRSFLQDDEIQRLREEVEAKEAEMRKEEEGKAQINVAREGRGGGGGPSTSRPPTVREPETERPRIAERGKAKSSSIDARSRNTLAMAETESRPQPPKIAVDPPNLEQRSPSAPPANPQRRPRPVSPLSVSHQPGPVVATVAAEEKDMRDDIQRAERLLRTVPENHNITCPICKKRRPGDKHQSRLAPTSAPARLPTVYSVHSLDEGDEGDDEGYGGEETELPPQEKSTSADELPPQTVVSRILTDLEADFFNHKKIYIELSEQYKSMDPASNARKRNALAQHLKESIDTLELKANEIKRLYDTIHYRDGAVLVSPLRDPGAATHAEQPNIYYQSKRSAVI